MREAEFLSQFLDLLRAPVAEMSAADKAAMIRTICDDAVQSNGHAPVTLKIVPFMTGRRPTDEAAHPGLGSSDSAAMLLPADPESGNYAYILYTIDGLDDVPDSVLDELALDATLTFCGTDASQTTSPVPGWNRRTIAPLDVAQQPVLFAHAAAKRLVLRIEPAVDLLPGAQWNWNDLDPRVRDWATDGADPFTFGAMFTEMVQVHIRLTHRGVPIASAATMLDVCDTRRFGSLYQRVMEGLIAPDTARQARDAGIVELHPSYHPWSPVLLIGSDKAALYTSALIEDIVYKQHQLTDPRWLMRVGLYLEFLTCMGIFEAVKDEVGDLLSPAEREAYEHSPFFDEIRKRIDPQRWKEVWKLRHIAFPKPGLPQTGPVSSRNLLQKRKAVLEFLHTHHQDLKHAIELAGANVHNAQETWGRVFRDAERAVLRKTPTAFPELDHLNKQISGTILWHQRGRLGLLDLQKWLPEHLTEMLGDQDGLFAAACHQYRASMNDVAQWGRRKRLMDYTGADCVPEAVSLLHAYMGGHSQHLDRLQSRDGYTDPVEIEAVLPQLKELHERQGEHREHRVEMTEDFFAQVPIFKLLSDEERLRLAKTARTIALGPYERIIVQGREGSSLFIVAEGRLEVLVRQDDDTDQRVGVLEKGEAFGEISLLSGAPRTATVRAIDGAMLYEIGKAQFEPIIRARPELVDELTTLMKQHQASVKTFHERYDADLKAKTGGRSIRRFFFGGA